MRKHHVKEELKVDQALIMLVAMFDLLHKNSGCRHCLVKHRNVLSLLLEWETHQVRIAATGDVTGTDNAATDLRVCRRCQHVSSNVVKRNQHSCSSWTGNKSEQSFSRIRYHHAVHTTLVTVLVTKTNRYERVY
jgi:hypothetical protein